MPPRPLSDLLPWPRAADDGTPLGIDLAALHLDVRRIVLSKFHVEGVDREDLVATVIAAIARRNRLPSAYDPRRASLSKYVYTVAKCQAANLANDARKHGMFVVASLSDHDNDDAPRTPRTALGVEVPCADDPIARFEEWQHFATFGGEDDYQEELWERALNARRREQAGEPPPPVSTVRALVPRRRARKVVGALHG